MIAIPLHSSVQVTVSIICIVIACIAGKCQADERWIDEAILVDGSSIDVERSVSYNFGNGDLSSALTRWPNQYAFKVDNPYSGKSIRWSGEKDFNPILLDFWNKVPYLVIVAVSTFSNLKQYGCPEIPYIFFRYDENSKHWNQIDSKDFPPQLLHANLSFSYDGHIKNSAKQSKEKIDSINATHERSSGNFTTRNIPTTFASWPSRYKNQYRVGHYKDGCRYTVPSNEDPTHPQSLGQPSQEAKLEILETKLYDPVWTIKGDAQIQFRDWSAIAWDAKAYASCRALVRKVGDDSDKPELRGWLLFVNDPTGTKKARDSGTIFCNTEMMWFIEYGLDRKHVYLSKFTIQGNFIYRLSFEKPDEPYGYTGGILQPTFRAEDGYLYFEWWNTNQSGWNRDIKRAMKVRTREPLPLSQAESD